MRMIDDVPFNNANRNIYKSSGVSIFMKKEQKVRVKCYHCGYEWDTASKAIMVTCPSCIKKTVRVVEKLNSTKSK